ADSCSRIAVTRARDAAIEWSLAAPIDASPAPIRKPTTMRLDDVVTGGRGRATRVAFGDRDAMNPFNVLAMVTLPAIAAPLLAMNDTAAPVMRVVVAVAACTAAKGPSVHTTDAFPAASVIDVAGETLPPPVTFHVSATFCT